MGAAARWVIELESYAVNLGGGWQQERGREGGGSAFNAAAPLQCQIAAGCEAVGGWVKHLDSFHAVNLKGGEIL